MPRKQQSKQSRKAIARKGAKRTKRNVVSVGAYAVQRNGNPREGNLVLQNEELWVVNTSADATVHASSFTPGVSGLPILDAEAQRFDLYRIKSCEVIYKPSCATTQAGRIVFAIDYDTVKLPTSVSAMTPMQPQARPQAFVGATIKVDPSRANKQFWLRTANGLAGETSAFSMVYGNIGAASGAGELWCRYVVEMTNPRAVTMSMGVVQMGKDGVNLGSTTAGDRSCPSCYVAPGPNASMQLQLPSPGRYFLNLGGLGDVATRNAILDSIVKTVGTWGDGSQWSSLVDYASAASSLEVVAGMLVLGPELFNSLPTVTISGPGGLGAVKLVQLLSAAALAKITSVISSTVLQMHTLDRFQRLDLSAARSCNVVEQFALMGIQLDPESASQDGDDDDAVSEIEVLSGDPTPVSTLTTSKPLSKRK